MLKGSTVCPSRAITPADPHRHPTSASPAPHWKIAKTNALVIAKACHTMPAASGAFFAILSLHWRTMGVGILQRTVHHFPFRRPCRSSPASSPAAIHFSFDGLCAYAVSSLSLARRFVSCVRIRRVWSIRLLMTALHLHLLAQGHVGEDHGLGHRAFRCCDQRRRQLSGRSGRDVRQQGQSSALWIRVECRCQHKLPADERVEQACFAGRGDGQPAPSSLLPAFTQSSFGIPANNVPRRTVHSAVLCFGYYIRTPGRFVLAAMC